MPCGRGHLAPIIGLCGHPPAASRRAPPEASGPPRSRQELGDAALWVAPEFSHPVGSLEIGSTRTWRSSDRGADRARPGVPVVGARADRVSSWEPTLPRGSPRRRIHGRVTGLTRPCSPPALRPGSGCADHSNEVDGDQDELQTPAIHGVISPRSGCVGAPRTRPGRARRERSARRGCRAPGCYRIGGPSALRRRRIEPRTRSPRRSGRGTAAS